MAVIAAVGATLGAQEVAAEVQEVVASPAASVLVVNHDGSADHTTIQAAVDAAPTGARIEIRAGRYEEKVKLAKTLTLVGSGWESCQIVSDLDKDAAPTLTIASTADVTVTGLKVTALGASASGSLRRGSALLVDGGKAAIADCAVLGSPASCVVIQGDATVTMTGSLVAGAWAEGIVIRQGKEGKGRVLVQNCAIRHNHHNEIKIGGGAPRTRIEGCWISGAGWHGIRYDGSAPEVIGNRFFGNERSGIYASGKTAARVEGNLFLDRGVSCWFENKDTILRNTFVGRPDGGIYGSADSAVSIIGQSKPRVEGNVIVSWANAVSVGQSSSEGPTNKLATEWTVVKNVLWKNGNALYRKGESVPLDAEAGNVEVDPGFVSAAQGDFRLGESSLARSREAGALEFPAAKSPWALQEEEKAVAIGPDSVAGRMKRQAEEARTRDQQVAAASLSKDWVSGALQIRDASLRKQSVASVLAALKSDTPANVEAGLTAFIQISEVAFDKAPFAEVTRGLARTLTGRPQVQAFYGLLNSRDGANPEDLALLKEKLSSALKADGGGALLSSGTHLLLSFTEREIKGDAADLVLAMFDSDKVETREVLRGLWGARVAPKVADRIIQLAAKGSRHRHDAIYFGLSTFYEKSPAVIEALFEACEDPDHNNSGRALWGLSYGVPEASHPEVGDFMLLLFEARSSQSIRRDCLQALRTYAGPKHLPKLKELAGTGLLSGDLQTRIDAIVKRLEGEDGK